jgi:hypothetical protein
MKRIAVPSQMFCKRFAFLVALVANVAFAVPAHAQGQGYDGRWDGFYACGDGLGKYNYPAFMWQNILFTIQGGQISARRDFTARNGTPVTAFFSGRIGLDGVIHIDLNETSTGPNNGVHVVFDGRSDPNGMIVLPWTANYRGVAVRSCQLTLRLAALSTAPLVQYAMPPTYYEPAEPRSAATSRKARQVSRPAPPTGSPNSLPPIRTAPHPSVINEDEKHAIMD